jgi:Holliday junction resolvasome RuvABC endonuclease subunit
VKALGLDIGFASFGWAIANTSDTQHPRALALGLIRTKKDPRKVLLAVDNHKRAQTIVRELGQVLELYPDVDIVCAETIAFVRSAVVMSQIGRAWGVVDALLEHRGLALLQASPQEIKRACCPSIKSASKLDVQEAVEQRFGPQVRLQLKPIPKSMHEHPCDALGAIWACLDRDEMRFERSISRARQRSIDELVV